MGEGAEVGGGHFVQAFGQESWKDYRVVSWLFVVFWPPGISSTFPCLGGPYIVWLLLTGAHHLRPPHRVLTLSLTVSGGMWHRVTAGPAAWSFPRMTPHQAVASAHALCKASWLVFPWSLFISPPGSQPFCPSDEHSNIPLIIFFLLKLVSCLRPRTLTNAYLNTISLAVGGGEGSPQERMALVWAARMTVIGNRSGGEYLGAGQNTSLSGEENSNF